MLGAFKEKLTLPLKIPKETPTFNPPTQNSPQLRSLGCWEITSPRPRGSARSPAASHKPPASRRAAWAELGDSCVRSKSPKVVAVDSKSHLVSSTSLSWKAQKVGGFQNQPPQVPFDTPKLLFFRTEHLVGGVQPPNPTNTCTSAILAKRKMTREHLVKCWV